MYFECVFQEKSEGGDDQQHDQRSVKERLGPPIIPHPSKLSLNNMKPKTVEQPVPAEKVSFCTILLEKIPEYYEFFVVGTVKNTSMCEYGGLFHSLGSNINRCEAYDYGNEDTKPVECLYME